MNLTKRSLAEFLGTFWIVLGGCGAALLSATIPGVGIGIMGVSLAFGLSVVTGMYALGQLSGGHFNPAITLGLATARRFPAREVIPYWVAQVAGAIVAALVLYLIAHGAPGFSAVASGFASNGFGDHSPAGYNLGASFLTELVMSFMLVMVALGSTHATGFKGFAPLAVGLALALIHLVSIPVTNTSVNPARSTGPALFAGGGAIGQLWLFWLAPLLGGILAGVVHPILVGDRWPSAVTPGANEFEAPDLPGRRQVPAR
jgi:aquaporin Z